MSTRRRAILFALVLILHYALTWACLLYLISGMSRLEHDAPETLLDTTARLLSRTLSAPLMPVVFQFRLGAWFPGLWGHLLYLANGALWASAVVWVADRLVAKFTVQTSSSIRIVEFEPRHQEAFTALNLAWIEEYFQVEEIDRRQLLNPADSILSPGGAILVAEDSTGVLGVCALLRASPGRYEISKLTVRSDLRGHGIGRQLLAAVIAHARTLDAKELFIESNTVLQPAVHLYRKAGFTEVPPPVSTEYSRGNIAFELDLT